MGEALIKWFGFRVILGLLPIGGSFLMVGMFSTPNYSNFVDLLSAGQLVLVGGALSAGAIGELLGAPKHLSKRRMAFGFACVVSFGISAIAYGGFAAGKVLGKPIDQSTIISHSVGFYVISLVAALACMLVAESAKKAEAAKLGEKK